MFKRSIPVVLNPTLIMLVQSHGMADVLRQLAQIARDSGAPAMERQLLLTADQAESAAI